jgi:hypothetical protein
MKTKAALSRNWRANYWVLRVQRDSAQAAYSETQHRHPSLQSTPLHQQNISNIGQLQWGGLHCLPRIDTSCSKLSAWINGNSCIPSCVDNAQAWKTVSQHCLTQIPNTCTHPASTVIDSMLSQLPARPCTLPILPPVTTIGALIIPTSSSSIPGPQTSPRYIKYIKITWCLVQILVVVANIHTRPMKTEERLEIGSM